MVTNVPEKMKLNKFQLVRCPRPAELASLHGYRVPSDGSYSGDSDNECNDSRKTEELAHAMDQVRQAVINIPKQD